MGPSQVFIVRHGEKPGDASTETIDDGFNLSARGHSRANALSWQANTVFGIKPKKIDWIIATAASKGSHRPIETVTPLAESLKLEINDKFDDDEYDELAQRILARDRFKDKVIVICWHHGKIPELIKALGGDDAVRPIVEGKWSADVFDRVIHLDYSGQTVVTTSLPQKLLFGDSLS